MVMAFPFGIPVFRNPSLFLFYFLCSSIFSFHLSSFLLSFSFPYSSFLTSFSSLPDDAILSTSQSSFSSPPLLRTSSLPLFFLHGRISTPLNLTFLSSPRQTVLYSAQVLRLPYSVTVFEDRMYWVDWSAIALFSADKFNGDNIEHVSAGHLVSAAVITVFTLVLAYFPLVLICLTLFFV